MYDAVKMDRQVGRLVSTRHPFEVQRILDETEPAEMATLVSTALARSLSEGKKIGYANCQDGLRRVLGL